MNDLAVRPHPWLNWLTHQILLPRRRTTDTPASPGPGARLTYLVFCWLVTASFLHQYSRLLVPLIPPTSYGREFLICGGQIFWQWAFLAFFRQPRRWDYLQNMMTISLGGGLLLALIQLLVPARNSPFLFGAMFTGVAGLMFLEHLRRTRILGISSRLTVTWVLYRVVLLGIILAL